MGIPECSTTIYFCRAVIPPLIRTVVCDANGFSQLYLT